MKLLDVKIDENLTLKQHIIEIFIKHDKANTTLFKIRYLVDKEKTLKQYNLVLVVFRLCYPSLVWAQTFSLSMKNIFFFKTGIVKKGLVHNT